MKVCKDVNTVISEFHNVSVDDLISKYGTPIRAMASMIVSDQTRLFNLLAQYYPTAVIPAIFVADDEKMFEQYVDLRASLVLDYIEFYQSEQILSRLLSTSTDRELDLYLEHAVENDSLFILDQLIEQEIEDRYTILQYGIELGSIAVLEHFNLSEEDRIIPTMYVATKVLQPSFIDFIYERAPYLQDDIMSLISLTRYGRDI